MEQEETTVAKQWRSNQVFAATIEELLEVVLSMQFKPRLFRGPAADGHESRGARSQESVGLQGQSERKSRWVSEPSDSKIWS
jgi:hypothetical protein